MYTSPILSVVVETPRNRVVRIGRPDGFPRHRAGQYVSIGDHGQPARKPYSVACSPSDVEATGELELLIQVADDETPGTHLKALGAGQLVDLEAPAGTFVLPAGDPPEAVALIGGGTGIAPLRAMLHELLAASRATRVSVLQSARTPDELSFSAELRGLAGSGRVALVETVTRDAPVSWPGRIGRVTADELAELIDAPKRTLCFVCGPESLVEGVPRLLAAIGVPAALVRTEQWADAALAR